MLELVTEVLVAPDGMDLDHPSLRHFALRVCWRGPRTESGRGGYAVVSGGDRHLSRAGNWRYNPEPHLQRHYRWSTLDDALDAAREALPTVTVMGRTWKDVQELEAAARDAR